MKTFQLVLTLLICTVLLPASTQAQQFMINETAWTINGPQHREEPLIPTAFDLTSFNTFGFTAKGDLEDFILNEMDQNHIPGLSAALVKEGEVVWSGAFGYADLESYPQKSVEESTLFYLASVTKTVTATALMQLWEDGLFGLGKMRNTCVVQ